MGHCHSKVHREEETNPEEPPVHISKGNLFNKLDTSIFPPLIAPYLDLGTLNKLSRTEKRLHAFFETNLSVKKLLHLILHYKLNDKEKVKTALAAGLNPILMEIYLILQREPSLALKRGHMTDPSGRKFYCSPLEAAHWTGNWLMRGLIFHHATHIHPDPRKKSAKTRALEQISQWDDKAYNYDLLLLRAEPDRFPILKKTPALIKQFSDQGEDKLYQWGEVNGKWSLTELDEDATQAFLSLRFPKYIDQFLTLESHNLSNKMYDILKTNHTLSRFDLTEFIRTATAFHKKYILGMDLTDAQQIERDDEWNAIGRTQIKMPAWIAATWFSNAFLPLAHNPPTLQLSYEDPNDKNVYGSDFYSLQTGVIIKGNDPTSAYSFTIPASMMSELDLTGIIELNQQIKAKHIAFISETQDAEAEIQLRPN